ncbi:Gluconate 5-dehydrogenase [Aquimixticola soesokkakensis]|uniref:Gluconate 5-dehydrogenase n=1 Tax=Aquimixticola soesokkakensis TaxID=1519096 RepID=A0A1Y5RDW5_9RHOB|nr:SDR family oxidoreductase [Aquimixticola soesokkakensis]SLN15140.1 Gluconate 5-dehydrogenase [Aquimixticola soesokkakensis]
MTQTTQPSPLFLITGGNRGLGKAMATALAAAGADIILTYRSGATEAQATVAHITALGQKAAALCLDTTAHQSFATFTGALETTMNALGHTHLTGLVNNAGFGVHAPFATTTATQLDDLFAVHVKGPYLLIQALLPRLKDGGRILFVSSGLSRFTSPGFSAYGTMKGAVDTLTRYVAAELGPRGISVNAIAPGAIETDFGGGVVRDNAAANAAVAQSTAMGRAGLADDIGGAVTALLMSPANWVTAQRIEASGGQNI